MKFEDEFKLYNYLTEVISGNDIDFIGSAISHWHAIGLDAFIASIAHDRERKLKGIIIIQAHSKDGFVLNENDFISKDTADIEFYYLNILPNKKSPLKVFFDLCEGMRDILTGLKNICKPTKGEREIYLVSIMDPKLHFFVCFKDKRSVLKYRPIFVLIDEGAASYLSQKVRRVKKIYDHPEIKSPLLGSLKSRLLKSSTKLIQGVISNRIQIENKLLFKKTGDNLILNTDIAESYKNILSHRQKSLPFESSKKSIIILTQPFSEDGQIAPEEMNDLIASTAEACMENDLKVAIKIHPRETGDKYDKISKKYNIDLISREFPAEDIFAYPNLACIVGFTSTSLINAKALFDVYSISIIDMLLKMTQDPYLELSGKDFKKIAKNFVNFIPNLETLREEMKKG